MYNGLKEIAQSNDTLLLSYANNIASKLAELKGDELTSLMYALHAEKLALSVGSNEWISRNNSRLSVIYAHTGNLEEAKRRGMKALYYAEHSQTNSVCLLHAYEVLESVYFESDDKVDSAVYYCEKFMSHALAIGDSSEYYYGYNSLVFDYMKLGDSVKEAESIRMLEKNIDKLDARARTSALLNLSGFYLEHHNIVKSLAFATRAKNELYYKSPELLAEIYGALTQIYQAKKDYEKAFFYASSWVMIEDSIKNNKLFEKMAEMNARFELEKKEKKIELLELLTVTKEKERKNIILITIIIVLLLSIVIMALYSRSRSRKLKTEHIQRMLDYERQKIHDILQSQDDKIQHEKQQATYLLKQNISIDMHDGLSSSITGLRYYLGSLIVQAPSETEKKTLTSVEKLLDAIYNETRNYTHSLKNSNNDHVYNLKGFLKELANQFKHNSKFKAVIEVDFENIERQLSAEQKKHLYLVLKEAITNVLKHADATELNIEIGFKENKCEFCIMDNGKGFLSDKSHTDEGIGLQGMYSRMKQLHGRLQVESGLFTKVSGYFPIN